VLKNSPHVYGLRLKFKDKFYGQFSKQSFNVKLNYNYEGKSSIIAKFILSFGVNNNFKGKN
jgi:hypothetical protein